LSLRVIQWTTGNVGKEAVKGVLAHPELHLVGCFAHSPEKLGRDVGELCGIAPLGFAAGDDVDALLALDADCVVYTPLFPDVDELCRILEAGVNVVTSAGFVTGWGIGDEARRRLEAAALRGGASIFGSGMTPGFNNLIGLISAGCSRRIEKVTVLESARADVMPSPETYDAIGMGWEADAAGLAQAAENGSRVFGDGVCLMADALGVELTEIRCAPAFTYATRDLDLGWFAIGKGCVAGVEVTWQGYRGERCVVELIGRWLMSEHSEPTWEILHGWRCQVDGYPGVKASVSIDPSPAALREIAVDPTQAFIAIGMSVTAMPVVNAIPAVCAAAPGIRTYADLPLITGRLT
jgi:hypothetical protein